MLLLDATKLAERIAAELTPYCDRIEIAGSIRRRRPVVTDIDLVVLPKPHKLTALQYRCHQRCEPVTGCDGGHENMIWRLRNGVQLDIFVARRTEEDLLERKPGNWGTLLLSRTGSRAHNIWLIEHAKRMGLAWNPYHGVYGPWGWPASKGIENAKVVCLAAEEEQEIFKVLELDWIEPEKRER